MPFTPPKSSAFKQFVVLDNEGVVAALSAIDGGQIDEILKRSAEEGSGGLGGEVDAKVVKARGQKAKSRKIEEEIRLTRTRHATAAKLLETLAAKNAIGVVDGPLDMEVFAQLEAGMVLQMRAALSLHPLHQADEMLRSFIQIAPAMGQHQTAKELKGVLKAWEVIAGTGSDDSRLMIEPKTTEPQVPRILLPLPKNTLEVSLDDVLGEVTVVAQVEKTLSNEDEPHQVIRMLKGGPATSLERETVATTLPEMLPNLQNIGVEIGMQDIFVPGPTLILRPICAYR